MNKLLIIILVFLVSCNDTNVDKLKIKKEKKDNVETTIYFDENNKIIKEEYINTKTGGYGIDTFMYINNDVFSKRINYLKNRQKDSEFYKLNGKLMISVFYSYGKKFNQNNEFEDKWYFWHQNGQLRTVCDYKKGIYINYYDNGFIKINGYIKNELDDSLWTYYSPTGDIVQELTYKEGKIINRNIINQLAVDSLFTNED